MSKTPSKPNGVLDPDTIASFGSPFIVGQKLDPFFRPLKWQKHLDAEIMDFLIHPLEKIFTMTCPPNSGKTHYIGLLMAWYITFFPKSDVLYIVHSSDVAKTLAEKFLYPYVKLFHEKIGLPLNKREDLKATSIKLQNGSILQLFGRKSGISGLRPNLLIVDDIYGSETDAFSSKILKETNAKFDGTILQRMATDGKVIVTQHRWHEEDIISHLHRYPKVRHLNYPSIPLEGEKDIIGRTLPTTTLVPKNFTYQEIMDKKSVSEYRFWAHLQGVPSKMDRRAFRRKDLLFYEIKDLPKKLITYATCDTARTVSEKSDYTVVQVWGYDKPNDTLYLLWQWREKLQTPDITHLFEQARERYPEIKTIYIEGIEVFQYAERSGQPVEQLKHLGINKWLRAQDASRMTTEHKIFINPALPHKEDYILEMVNFDNAPHDDMVDATAYAAIVRKEVRGGDVYVSKAFTGGSDDKEDKDEGEQEEEPEKRKSLWW